jgi:hypothetical protein
MRRSRSSTERRDWRPIACAGTLGLATLVLLTGCYGSHMNFRGVTNPIFLGERMHIGEGPRFELAEEREKYRAQALNAYFWIVLPGGNETSDRDRKDAVARDAKERLGFSSYRAVRTKGIEVGSTSSFFFVWAVFHSAVTFYGELVEVVPPAEGRAGERETGS